MPIPLLGLASILGREYANTLPNLGVRNDILKIVSPQTYYGNQLIQYLADKFNPDLGDDLKGMQAIYEWNQAAPYTNSRLENRLDEDTYNQHMAELSAQVNAPGSLGRFEDTLRDLDYGTIYTFGDSKFVGPNPEDSDAFKYYEETLPVAVKQLPSESNFTPIQLEALERSLLGNSFEVGPQPYVADTPRRPDFTPEGSGSGFMPQGGDKNNFDVQQEYEQYLRGGLTGYRR
jgi:hypothetical protein